VIGGGSLPLPKTADCVIIGGGAVGCSLAYHLARSGMRPLLLERDALGSGSTSRAAGGVRQQFSTEVNVRVGMLSRRMLESFPEEIGATADLREIGYLFLGSTSAEAEQFRRNVEMQQRVGLADVRYLSVAEALELVPDARGDDLTGATFCPSDGIAGPNEVTLGYAGAARRHGATIVESCTVTAIELGAERVSAVVAGGQRVATPLVMNCAGPYAAMVGKLAGVDVPVKPYRRHLFLTEAFQLSKSPPMTVDFHTSFYFHPEGDGLLLGMSDPAEPSSFDTDVAWDFLEHLVEHATWRVPALASAAIKTGWAGLYEVTPDNQAIIGEAPSLGGFWLCCGFSGHGFMQAPAAGHLLAELVLGRVPEIDISAFAPDRFGSARGTPEAAVI
jgi:glycine/D-amino acid oxidase-like deaminating enzyme